MKACAVSSLSYVHSPCSGMYKEAGLLLLRVRGRTRRGRRQNLKYGPEGTLDLSLSDHLISGQNVSSFLCLISSLPIHLGGTGLEE